MEIHRFEKAWLFVSVLLIVGFIATVAYGGVVGGVQMVDDAGGQVFTEDPVNSSHFEEPGVYRSGPGEYEVYMVAKRFAFEPGTNEPVRVPAGSEVTFHVASADVVHGFEVVGTNVNAMAIPGQIARMEVRFEDPANYGIVCNEYCGAAHHNMAGELVVVPTEEFDAGNVSEVPA
jgi:cytochrome c oxidase subunit 2